MKVVLILLGVAIGVAIVVAVLIGIKKYNAAVAAEYAPQSPDPDPEEDAMSSPLEPAFTDIDAARAQELMAADEPVTVLDVRMPEEWAGGVIEGAQLISMQELQGREGEIPEGPVIVVCAMGGRSAAVAEYLCSRGRKDVYNLDGGMSAWNGGTVRP